MLSLFFVPLHHPVVMETEVMQKLYYVEKRRQLSSGLFCKGGENDC